MCLRLSLILATVILSPSHWAFAQGEIDQTLLIDPNGPIPLANRQLTLRDLVQAKIDTVEGVQKLIVMVDAYRTEMRAMPIDGVRKEQRVREVPDKDGKLVKKVDTVQIPFIFHREVEVEVSAGRKPSLVDLADIAFYDMENNAVPFEEVAKRLTTLRPLFLLERFTGEAQPLPELYKQVLNSDCLIAVTKKQIRPIKATGRAPKSAPLRAIQLSR